MTAPHIERSQITLPDPESRYSSSGPERRNSGKDGIACACRLSAALRQWPANQSGSYRHWARDWSAGEGMRPPLAIELFAGLHGWGEGLVAEGFRVIGFDLFDMCAIFNRPRPKGIEIVLQDVLTLHGSQFRDAALIVASPPCQNYSYLAMPWSRSKDPNNSKAAKALRYKWETEGPDNRLFDACFRIQREAIEARHAQRCWYSPHEPGADSKCHIPLIVENVRGAQPWVGRSAWNYGSFHLWGDVPALMPINLRRTVMKRGVTHRSNGATNFHGSDGIKQTHSRGDNQTCGKHRMGLGDGVKVPGQVLSGTKIGGDWFSDPQSTCRKHGSRSNARKMASAMIAKIPFELASWIARTYKPRQTEAA